MELQAIKEKLQQLQAEPPAAEALTLPLPWADVTASGRYDGSAHTAAYNTAHTTTQTTKDAQAQSRNRADHRVDRLDNAFTEETTRSPQERAIEALKQRSAAGGVGSRGAAMPASGYDRAAIAHRDNLVAQEICRLEVQASNINERSRQQAADIMALKRSAQQASVGLRRQGIQSHPQLAVITDFLTRYESAVVPHVERDSQGRFELTYDTIDFHRAEQDAMENAHTLRRRQQGVQASAADSLPPSVSGALPFAEPIASAFDSEALDSEERFGTSVENKKPNPRRSSDYPEPDAWLSTLSNFFASTLGGFGGLVEQVASPFMGLLSGGSKRRHRRKVVRPEMAHSFQSNSIEEGFLTGDSMDAVMDTHYAESNFSWLDGTIWFSGAAISRIVIQTIAVSYPLVQTAALLILVGIITFAIYRVISSSSHDYSLVYRLCIVMAGLFLAGLF